MTPGKDQKHPTLEELEDALIKEQFFIEYQPILRIDGKECVGAEALIRWRRGEELIPPSEFIPVAENTLLSGMITYWLIENISRELGEWLRTQESVFVSINIPPELLGRGGLMHVASNSGLLEVADKIVMEVTERGIPDNLGLQALVKAQELGVRVCLDDVGVTNENLFVYARANVDLIKLDKSIAAEMLEPDWTVDKIGVLEVFTRSTTIQVIAEGVETEFQRDVFQELGVPMAQGWYFSYPLSAEGLFEFFRASGTGG